MDRMVHDAGHALGQICLGKGSIAIRRNYRFTDKCSLIKYCIVYIYKYKLDIQLGAIYLGNFGIQEYFSMGIL